ncbi:hypothetical protein WN51_09329 [Melipona quadrifasciata]|uniref:Uncharacterized protein n=1 Tax=Melipona quadrifasciata TaxID=166423 RepID=A0A0N0BIM3_9HYME|nr:hypothetical protein WN51_09329 [Melipona quadrifasciata]
MKIKRNVICVTRLPYSVTNDDASQINCWYHTKMDRKLHDLYPRRGIGSLADWKGHHVARSWMEIEFNAKEAASINRPRRQWGYLGRLSGYIFREEIDSGNNDVSKLPIESFSFKAKETHFSEWELIIIFQQDAKFDLRKGRERGKVRTTQQRIIKEFDVFQTIGERHDVSSMPRSPINVLPISGDESPERITPVSENCSLGRWATVACLICYQHNENTELYSIVNDKKLNLPQNIPFYICKNYQLVILTILVVPALNRVVSSFATKLGVDCIQNYKLQLRYFHLTRTAASFNKLRNESSSHTQENSDFQSSGPVFPPTIRNLVWMARAESVSQTRVNAVLSSKKESQGSFWRLKFRLFVPRKTYNHRAAFAYEEDQFQVYLLARRSMKIRQRLHRGHSRSMHISHLRITPLHILTVTPIAFSKLPKWSIVGHCYLAYSNNILNKQFAV